MSSLVPALAPVLRDWMDKPLVLFGHSMGAVIAFEIALHMRREYGREPIHLFVSGRRAPQMGAADARTYALPDEQFVEELRRLNGTPKEVFENAELLQLMMPVLRADFEICQTYAGRPGAPLNCPITAFGGLEDPGVRREHLEAWREQTTASFSLHMLDGDHFFLSSARESLCRLMAQAINESVRRTSSADWTAELAVISRHGMGAGIGPNGGSPYVL
jgi:medium-chain acyl-[acyl-carrier-protein] hydrolase